MSKPPEHFDLHEHPPGFESYETVTNLILELVHNNPELAVPALEEQKPNAVPAPKTPDSTEA